MSWYSKFHFVILVLATFSVLDQCTYPWDMYIAFLVLAKSKKNQGGLPVSERLIIKGLRRRGFTSLVDLCRIKMSDVAVLYLLVKTAQVSFYIFLRPRVSFEHCTRSGLYCSNWRPVDKRWWGKRGSLAGRVRGRAVLAEVYNAVIQNCDHGVQYVTYTLLSICSPMILSAVPLES